MTEYDYLAAMQQDISTYISREYGSLAAYLSARGLAQLRQDLSLARIPGSSFSKDRDIVTSEVAANPELLSAACRELSVAPTEDPWINDSYIREYLLPTAIDRYLDI